MKLGVGIGAHNPSTSGVIEAIPKSGFMADEVGNAAGEAV